jgi:hypothetical protein
MEINGRFWGSLGLANQEPIEAPADYSVGMVARDPIAELKHLVRVMAPGRHGPTGRGPSRWVTLRQLSVILHPTRDSYNWTVDDPEPGRQEWRRFLLRAVGRG